MKAAFQATRRQMNVCSRQTDNRAAVRFNRTAGDAAIRATDCNVPQSVSAGIHRNASAGTKQQPGKNSARPTRMLCSCAPKNRRYFICPLAHRRCVALATPRKTGKIPVLDATRARLLLDHIDATMPIGLRDRALIALVFWFARVGAALAMRVDDVDVQQRRLCARRREKGGQGARHAVSPTA